MANFIVTFQIRSDESYAKRYGSFMRRVNEIARGVLWSETTSFLAFSADLSASELCAELVAGSEFDPGRDIIVALDALSLDKAAAGPIKSLNLLEACVGF